MRFNQLSLHPNLIESIRRCGYQAPTAIQQQAIPQLLEGHDLLGLAQTGTGKTAAFVLPTLQRLQHGPRKTIRALILTPTRELAEQIHTTISQLAHGTGLRSCAVYGGVSKTGQLDTLQKGAEILVACPGRLLDHLRCRSISLSTLEVLIIDEADQMFDQGFLPDIRRILHSIPAQRQSMVFSATMPESIRHLAEEVLTCPVTVQVDHEKPAATISHAIFQIPQERKTALLEAILHDRQMASTLVFTRTKHKAKHLARHLQDAGFKATSLQGNLSQNQRRQAMDGFRSGRFNILVATDIAARGIDVSDISHVVNYDAPDTIEAYTHRVGRTGRAEKTGQAFTFATNDDCRIIQQVERKLGRKMLRDYVTGLGGGNKEATDRPLALTGKEYTRGGKSYTAKGGKISSKSCHTSNKKNKGGFTASSR